MELINNYNNMQFGNKQKNNEKNYWYQWWYI